MTGQNPQRQKWNYFTMFETVKKNFSRFLGRRKCRFLKFLKELILISRPKFLWKLQESDPCWHVCLSHTWWLCPTKVLKANLSSRSLWQKPTSRCWLVVHKEFHSFLEYLENADARLGMKPWTRYLAASFWVQ